MNSSCLSNLNIIHVKSRAYPQLLDVILPGCPPPLPISGHTGPYGAEVSSQIVAPCCHFIAGMVHLLSLRCETSPTHLCLFLCSRLYLFSLLLNPGVALPVT